MKGKVKQEHSIQPENSIPSIFTDQQGTEERDADKQISKEFIFDLAKLIEKHKPGYQLNEVIGFQLVDGNLNCTTKIKGEGESFDRTILS